MNAAAEARTDTAKIGGAVQPGGNHAKWPRNEEPSRLRPLCTPHIEPKFSISPDETAFTIGSCFARNIEEYLWRAGMRVPTLDFSIPRAEFEGRQAGILNKYSPPSILHELQYALEPTPVLEEDQHFLKLDGDMVIDLHLHSNRAVPLDRARERRRQVRDLFGAVRDSGLIVITLGLVEAWYDRENRTFINEPSPTLLARNKSGRFEFRRLGYRECFDATTAAIELLNRSGREKRVILTVSPVPFERTFTNDDVLVANMYSKSVLRAVAGDLDRAFDNVQYFPSYEMATLSAPDAIWARDNIHLRDEAVGRIVERFIAVYCRSEKNETLDTYVAARLSLSSGDYEAAYTALKALDGSREGALFLQDLCEACEKTGRYAEGQATARRLVEVQPEVGPHWYRLAHLALRAGDFDAALEANERSLVLDQHIARGHEQRSHILQSLNRTDEAIEEIKRALAVAETTGAAEAQEAPTDRIVTRLLVLLLRQKRYDEAKAEAEARVDGTSAHAPLFLAASRAHRFKGDFSTALTNCRRALELAPNAEAHRELGAIQLDMGDAAAAFDTLQPLYATDGANPIVSRLYVRAIHKCGRQLDFPEVVEHAAQINPNDPWLQDLRKTVQARSAKRNDKR